MPEIQIPIIGTMNGDDPPEVLPKGVHRTAYNLIFRGDKGNKRPENMPGTRQISFVLPSGTNVCIGAFYDSVNARVFYMNYNSSGTHGIYIFNVLTEIVQTLIQNGAGTNGDILGFDPTVPIPSINIIYGDVNSSDIITFVDSQGRPTKLNIARYLANTYALVKRTYIDVAKAPPQMPPKSCYENDANVKINNLRNSLFQFKYRYVFDDNEKSVWCSGGIVPLPQQISTQLTNSTDFTLNSRISLNFSTGDLDVTAIEISVRQVKDGFKSDWLLVDSLNKASLSIPSNDLYTYRFYNDGLYPAIDPQESVLLYDFAPQKANCQELLNGNVLGYAGITEGYNPVTSNMSVNQTSLGSYKYYDINGLLFFAVISGLDSGAIGTTMKVYLYGTGSNDINGNVVSLLNSNANFVINAIDGGGVARGTAYQTTADANTVASILSAVSSGLVTNGWTQASLSGNILTMTFPSNITLLSSGVQNNLSNLNNGEGSLAYPFNSAYQVGLVYFDAKGRTNGVTTNKTVIFNTPGYPTGISQGYPIPALTINHRPPTWASYYHVVRTANLTYSKLLYWISKECYSDPATNLSTDQFAYLSIDNISFYNTQSSATQGVVSYDFTTGDRIRLLMRFNASGSGTQISYDYEVVGTVVNPIVGGVARYGVFIKIYYPTADIGANLKFDGSYDYMNYEMVIYNYNKHVSTENNTFFEISKAFGIGNPGTANAYHIGLDQTQSSNLATPAIITIANGDYFYRFRNVPVGGTYVLQSVAFNNGFVYISPGFSIATNSITANYTVQSSSPQYSDNLSPGDYTPAAAFFLNTGTFGIKIRLRTSIPVIVDGPTSTAVYIQAINPDGTFQLVTIYQPQSMINGQTYTVNIDATMVVQPNAHLHLLIQNSSKIINQHVYPFNLTLDVLSSINIPVIDASFSDVYKLITNTNNRPNLVDPNARQTYFSTLFRFSNPYQKGTNLNGMNRFYPNNYDTFDNSFGDVMRMKARQRELRIFQKRKTGVVGVYNKFIKNNDGSSQLIVSDTIITPNNIQYYDGDWGIGNQVMGLCSDGYRDYYPDPVKGFLIRLSNDGNIPISELYKEQIWAGANIPNYQNNYPYAYGGYAKILGCFNFKKDKQGEYICVLQNGTGVTGSTIAFDERDNSFTSFYSFQPDMILCAGNKLLSWVNGNLYVHDNTNSYNTFYGTRYDSSFEFIMNESPSDEKEFSAIGFNAPNLWDAPTKGDITTSYGQQCNIVSQDYDIRGVGAYQAAFWRDMNSKKGLVNGDFLNGIWLDVKLSNHGTVFSFIQGIYIILVPDPKTR